MVVLPLLDAVVLSMNFLEVRVHFLVLFERHRLLILYFLGLVLLGHIVFK